MALRKAWAAMILLRGVRSLISCLPVKNISPALQKVSDMGKNRQEGNPLCQWLSSRSGPLGSSVLLPGTSFAIPSPRQSLGPSCFHFPWMYIGTGEESLLLKCLKPRTRASRVALLPTSVWRTLPQHSLVSCFSFSERIEELAVLIK